MTMGTMTDIEVVKAAQKAHRCSWCAEKIDAGSSYSRWRYYGDDGPTVVKIHPECKAALDEVNNDPDFEEWCEGDNPRGCNCGHDLGCTRCQAKMTPNHSFHADAFGARELKR